MGNMSYCRFQNTLGDLRDCAEHMGHDDPDDLGRDEARARLQLLQLCAEIASDYEYEIETAADDLAALRSA